MPNLARKLPVGAEFLDEGLHARVWAPNCRHVVLVTDPDGPAGEKFALAAEPDGYFSALIDRLEPGTPYRYRLDGGQAYPDPASRFQPEGPHGPSMIVDPTRYAWRDTGWRGVSPGVHIIYEMHIGTFTPPGTWQGAIAELPALADLGITVIELMPVADFTGDFGWGYDGVDLFAPTRL